MAEQDPPSRPVAQPLQPQPPMDGSQLVQRLSVQAGNMAGDLQHNVRALMVRASSPVPVSDGHDEVSSLRKQRHHQQQAHRVLQTMLQNQALAIETFQSKWQMAGQEAHFIARTRSQSEDFVLAELTAVQRFEDSLQRQYDGQLLSAPNHKSQIASDFKSRSPNRKNIPKSLSKTLQIAVQIARFVICSPFQIAAESQRRSLQIASDLRFAIRIANRNRTKSRDLEHLGQLRSHVNAPQDKCREHVGQEEDKMRKELQHALTKIQHVSRPTATSLTTS